MNATTRFGGAHHRSIGLVKISAKSVFIRIGAHADCRADYVTELLTTRAQIACPSWATPQWPSTLAGVETRRALAIVRDAEQCGSRQQEMAESSMSEPGLSDGQGRGDRRRAQSLTKADLDSDAQAHRCLSDSAAGLGYGEARS